jgi:hypothetical protein
MSVVNSNNRHPDDLIRFAHPTGVKQARELLDVSQLIHDHPELLEQVAVLVYSRLETNHGAASVHEALERVRWNSHVKMSNVLAPMLARMLVYMHPDLVGQVEVHSIPLDEALGMRIADKKLPNDYARQLQWADGTPLSEPHPASWRKAVQAVRPVQGELFPEVAA